MIITSFQKFQQWAVDNDKPIDFESPYKWIGFTEGEPLEIHLDGWFGIAELKAFIEWLEFAEEQRSRG